AGARLKLRGGGEAGGNGGSAGDLYVLLRVDEHPIFARDGVHVVCEVPVSIAQAALGAEIDIPTLEIGSAGDLYVLLRVDEHPIFARDGVHVVCEVPVSIAQAALGAEIDIPTL